VVRYARAVLEPGARLAGWVIEQRLCAGGTSVVYGARDAEDSSAVALEVLAPTLVKMPERRARVLAEATKAKALEHPNVARVLAAGVEDGHVYVVTELVNGRTLRSVIDEGRLPASRALDIASAVVDGVGAAHALGVVHGDLEPENIMLGDADHVTVLGVGVVKPDVGSALSQTVPGDAAGDSGLGVLGTPGYMAPEQARGEHLDARTDVFAVGVLLYEMITGVRPFQGRTALAVLTATVDDDPAPVSSHVPGTPKVVETVLVRCLAKDPKDRYASAEELSLAIRAAVREVSAHELATTMAIKTPLPALVALPASVEHERPSPSPEVVPPTPSRRARLPWLLLAVITLVFMLIGYFVANAFKSRRAEDAPPPAGARGSPAR
jgi:serine/threonine-protein kinase